MASSPESYFLGYLFDSEPKMNEEEEEEEEEILCGAGLSTPLKNNLYTSDDEFFADGLHDMNLEEMERYHQAIDESEGFDVPSFPKSVAFGIIIPWEGNNFPTRMQQCAEEAIKHYNNENGTDWEMVKIVKVNVQAICDFMYYITFEVKSIGKEFPATVFQAKVLDCIDDTIKVELCRPKPFG